MDNLPIERLRDCLQAFDFKRLFIEELGWSPVRGNKPIPIQVQGRTWQVTALAELSGVVAFVVVGLADKATRLAIHNELTQRAYEHLIIFVDSDKSAAITQSLWFWAKRDGNRLIPREHLYVKGQPGDLFISKISGMVVDINELDANGNFPLAALVARLQKSLDIERVTKKFFKEYDAQRLEFVELITGIADERERRWYASVLLNRLMFIWFLQRKRFLDGGNADYLVVKLGVSGQREVNGFYRNFLQVLFFEGFGKPVAQRSEAVRQLIGDICYLDGGLFIPHRLEDKYQATINVPDQAFANLFRLFATYSWNLNDSPGGADNEINPDVLGYIFEKYINQKAFGAYYTRPEITEYLCERTIHRLIVARVNAGVTTPFANFSELLLHLNADLCRVLLLQVLPDLKLLDPACGSGAFLVAAMKTLINVYSAVLGRIKTLGDAGLSRQLGVWEREHRNLGYFIKRTIISKNLFGADIMEEATEIAKLRLFLALVASAQTVEQLEPLPNIDFNIIAGNSLVGLLRVDAHEFETKANATADLFRKSYRQILDEKNRLIKDYRDTTAWSGGVDLGELKSNIERQRQQAQVTLNELLLDAMQAAGVKFEAATWDAVKGKAGKPVKRGLKTGDVAALQPLHWGFEFDEVLHGNGGFDAIITNPPWEILKPQAKEFFAEYSGLVSKNKMTIKEFEQEQDKLLANEEINAAWLEYLSRFPHVSAWYRAAVQFKHQSAVVNGKKTGSDVNLYKLFTEQCVNLLRHGGECGIVIPSGIYTDLGAKGLRDLLFAHNQVTGLFGFENRKEVFEGVHRSFKFVVLTFEKGGTTTSFPAAFMRHEVSELGRFPEEGGLPLTVELIRRLSPDSHSVMEFKTALDIHIAEKMLRFPLLGEKIAGTWNLRLTREFDMTNDSHLFKTEPGEGRLPLYEGKMIHQFTNKWGEPKYWLDEKEARAALLGRTADNGQKLDYQGYRLGFRDIAASTNERTMIMTVLSPMIFCNHKLPTAYFTDDKDDYASLLYVCAVMNSFIVDYILRLKVTNNLTFFLVYPTPVPRLTAQDPQFAPIVTRAARLICTSPEFADLATAVGITMQPLDATERAQLRAELDGLIAHLYGLSEDEFIHILGTFPLVDPAVKDAAVAAYKTWI